MNTYRMCDPDNGEDDTCTDAFSPFSYSIREHLVYFGFDVAHPEYPVFLPSVAVA